MSINFRIGVLGAGLGSRLREQTRSKPLAKVGGETLIGALLGRFIRAGANDIHCALRAELMDNEMRAELPRLPGVEYYFVDTESSLHTLNELILSWPKAGPTLFSMADTIMLPADFDRFMKFCSQLGPAENAVLATRYIDDEKPLYVKTDGSNMATGFGPEPSPVITSGMYFLSPQAMKTAAEMVNSGTHKMRNFLSGLAENGASIKTFVVDKTIDVDHPSDLAKAADFLRGD